MPPLRRFKVKVGLDLQDDIRRCSLIRQMIGPSNTLVGKADVAPERSPSQSAFSLQYSQRPSETLSFSPSA